MPEERLTMDVYPNVTEIRGLSEEAASRMFGCTTLQFEPDNRGSVPGVERRSTDLVWDSSFGVATIPTCRFEESLNTLCEAGYSVCLNNRSSAVSLADHDWTSAEEPWVTEFAQSIQTNAVGRILIDAKKQKKFTVQLICELFPQSN